MKPSIVSESEDLPIRGAVIVVREIALVRMGGSASTAAISLTRTELQKMTADEVAALAERRQRPRIISQTIRENELDGATILALEESDVNDLVVSTLERKKLLGVFRELTSTLEVQPLAAPSNEATKAKGENVTGFTANSITVDDCKPSLSREAKSLGEVSRTVLRDYKYDSAWAKLSLRVAAR